MKVKLAQAIAASNRCAIRSSQLLPLPTRRPPAADDQRTSIVSPARMLRDWRRVLRFGRPGHGIARDLDPRLARSEEHTSELQSLMRISYAVFCLKKKTTTQHTPEQLSIE